MKFIAAQWMNTETGGRLIVAYGDDGSVTYVPGIDSDVPPWPEYIAEGGEIQPAEGEE